MSRHGKNITNLKTLQTVEKMTSPTLKKVLKQTRLLAWSGYPRIARAYFNDHPLNLAHLNLSLKQLDQYETLQLV